MASENKAAGITALVGRSRGTITGIREGRSHRDEKHEVIQRRGGACEGKAAWREPKEWRRQRGGE